MANICGFTVILSLLLMITDAQPSAGIQQKIRQKREWIVPPRKLKENVNYMHLEYIAKIRSDEETRTTIRYSLTGPGADQFPLNLFTVGSENGLVKVHGVLDREEMATYHLRGVAKFLNGSYAENDIELKIVVLDENDCAPVFNTRMNGSVRELSSRDTYVMSITATDADEEGTLHSKISYSIVQQSPANMFYIDQASGGIYVMHKTLDRETQDTYTLKVKGTDMYGAPNGNTGMGEVVISILDVNDNIPILEKSIYQCRVEENTKNVEILRIQAIDADLIHTDNWLAVFSILSGNEASYFSITTDVNTNEGILMLNKELDYEELKEISLQVSVSNKAAYHSSVIITQSKTYHIRVSVVNQPEGPRFKPAVKVISLSEDSTSVDIRKVLINYAAIDSDTLRIATNVRYSKKYDVDNWLLIDERTADIRLNKVPDYESKFLINGTYYAHIICITKDYPAKTATGTIAIQVEDFNDHCPVLSSASHMLCYGEHAVHVTAVDRDHFPNAAPFDFTVKALESWSVQRFNDTTAIFRSHATLWPGVYRLLVKVQDQQGKFCGQQVLQIDVCTCDASKVCLTRHGESRFGAAGVLLMLLGLLLLLLFPLLLLFCICSGEAAAADFKTIPYDAKEHLIVYNTEQQGNDTEVARLQMSKTIDKHQCSNVEAQKMSDGVDAAVMDWSSFHQYHRYGQNTHHLDGELMYAQKRDENSHTRFQRHDIFEDFALSNAFLINYYSNKARSVAKENVAGDHLCVYDYEGQESCTGSFEDICSLMYEEDNLAFLDDLGPKFKTLAEICSGSTMKADISVTTPATPRPVASLTQVDVKALEKVSVERCQETKNTSTTTILHASGLEQVTGATATGMYVHEKLPVPNPTLFVQQPALYYTSTKPLYVVDPHPALLVTSSPVLSVQENVLVVEKELDVAARGAVRRDVQQYQGVVLIEKQQKKGSVQAQGCVSGAIQSVQAEMIQSTVARGVRHVPHPTGRVMPTASVQKSVGEFYDSLDMGVHHNMSTAS